MKQIRVGIIGQGRSGRDIHGAYLATDRRFRIVAAVDFLEDRRRRAAEEFQCDVCADYRCLLDRRDIDLIVNASFSHLHAPISLEFLRAGFNVLSEKPAAAHVADMDRLIAASKKARRVYAIFQQSHYAPYFQQVRKVIGSGVLGRIVQISMQWNGFGRRWDWQTLTSYEAGSLLNTGPHPLEQALVLFGEGAPEVTCWMDRTEGCFGDAENHVKLVLSGAGHPTIDLEISSACAYPGPLYNVYGTRGGMKATGSAAEWKYIKAGEAPKQRLTTRPLAKPDGTPAYPAETLTWHTDAWPCAEKKDAKSAGYSAASAPSQGNLNLSFYSMLHRTLTKGVPLEITPEQVRRLVAVIEESHRQNPQIRRKRPVGEGATESQTR